MIQSTFGFETGILILFVVILDDLVRSGDN